MKNPRIGYSPTAGEELRIIVRATKRSFGFCISSQTFVVHFLRTILRKVSLVNNLSAAYVICTTVTATKQEDCQDEYYLYSYTTGNSQQSSESSRSSICGFGDCFGNDSTNDAHARSSVSRGTGHYHASVGCAHSSSTRNSDGSNNDGSSNCGRTACGRSGSDQG